MQESAFVGPLIRMLRLEKNWSQETLCRGICAVSYLSKIEQGRVAATDEMIGLLLERLDCRWAAEEQEKAGNMCEEVYEAVFAGEKLERYLSAMASWDEMLGPWYLDLSVLRAYAENDLSEIPEQMQLLLNNRQSCLVWLIKGEPEQAMRIYPCALATMEAGIKAYQEGNYIRAMELLQQSYDMACQDGSVSLMLTCQTFLASCYSDLRRLDDMRRHYRMARRIANALGEEEMAKAIEYNFAATQLECGDAQGAYRFFSALENGSVLDLHKLAISCEKLGRTEEAKAALDRAEPAAEGLEKQMCALVRYRLEHPAYLRDETYGKLLIDTFERLRRERPAGYARFHLPWVEEWCAANRQYRLAYEITKSFT